MLSLQKAKSQQREDSHFILPADLEASERHEWDEDHKKVHGNGENCLNVSLSRVIKQCRLHPTVQLIDSGSNTW